jgi:diguanylate cyclase (GGDEF)-like protein
MSLRARFGRLFFGTDPTLQRLLRYWCATCLLYAICLGTLWVQTHHSGPERDAGTFLSWFGMACVLSCYVLIRASKVLRIRPAQLAALQGLLALSLNVAAYTLSGPIRGASLMLMLVAIVFCMFSLRPRATLALSSFTVCALGGTMAWMVVRDPVRFPAEVEAVHFGLAALSLLAVTVLTGEMSKLRARLKRQKEELLAAVATIRTLATVDELTSLANRRHMNELLGAVERRERSGGQPVCIALLDIDFFKSINDRYGHAGGDAVLRSFAATAREALRGGDVLARWGGEEFLLMLPNSALADATMVLGRMAERVGAMRIAELDGEPTITFSAGLVERFGDEPFASTISRADRAMYIAKSSGRNQVIAMAVPGPGEAGADI